MASRAGLPELPPGPLYLFDKLVPNLCRSLWGAPAGIKPVENAELALPSKSTSISYQRAPTVSSDVSETSILNSPNIPCCLSVLLTSLIKITGGWYGPLPECQPSPAHEALPVNGTPVTEVSVRA